MVEEAHELQAKSDYTKLKGYENILQSLAA
jgi:hypothetical protein